MKTIMQLHRLFAFSENTKKYFFTEFSNGVNIVTGRNTSGKSTVVQSIIYACGVNDGKDKLYEILEEEPLFRIDFTLTSNNVKTNITFVRDGDSFYIRQDELPVKSFHGINSDHAMEHVKLKEHISNLFGFTMQLESKGEYKSAPLESMFLPYYVSQAVGWVYLHKSFSNLEYYRNFREDYLDYYLGIENPSNRVEKHKLEAQRNALQQQAGVYADIDRTDAELQATKLVDEAFMTQTREYIEGHKNRQKELLQKERDYVMTCNQFTYYKQRRAVLLRVSQNHKHQSREGGKCPICFQILPSSLPDVYEFLQDRNDTKAELAKYNELIRKSQSDINSLQKSINENRASITQEYEVLRRINRDDVTYDSWINTKATTKLIQNVTEKLGRITIEIENIRQRLSLYKADEDIDLERGKKSNHFRDLFFDYLRSLQVKDLGEEDRFTRLYQISSFPYQGVELHKTIMAYHFAYNNVIQETDYVHRLPFMLDAIFKEDIDPINENLIIGFIAKYKPADTQLIITISESNENQSRITGFNSRHFGGSAKIIVIGEGKDTRSFLAEYKDEHKEYLEETFRIANTV